MRSAGSDGGQGKTKASLSLVCDAVGDLATVAGPGRIPARAADHRSDAAGRRGAIRHSRQRGKCRQPNPSYSPACTTSAAPKKAGEGHGNDGRVENEENQT